MDLSKLPDNLETITLNEQTNYRLIEISKIKDCFEAEIRYQQALTSRLSKCITFFNYKDYIVSPAKQFPDDIFLFFIAHNANTSANKLNSNLKNKSEWAYQ